MVCASRACAARVRVAEGGRCVRVLVVGRFRWYAVSTPSWRSITGSGDQVATLNVQTGPNRPQHQICPHHWGEWKTAMKVRRPLSANTPVMRLPAGAAIVYACRLPPPCRRLHAFLLFLLTPLSRVRAEVPPASRLPRGAAQARCAKMSVIAPASGDAARARYARRRMIAAPLWRVRAAV